MVRPGLLRRAALAALLVAAAGASPLGAQQQASEYEVKAAFLYNFARFVEWPADAFPPSSPFVVALLGEDPFGGLLEQTLAGKTINGRAVLVRRLAELEGETHPHILFLASDTERDLPRILERLQGTPVLTVSDSEGFAEKGVMVNFVVRQRRVRFEVNLPRAEKARLKISSQLLQLATLVAPRS